MVILRSKWLDTRLLEMVFIIYLLLATSFVSTHGSVLQEGPSRHNGTRDVEVEHNYLVKVMNSTSQVAGGYKRVWPEMKVGWKIVVGTIVGFLGAAFGTVGGVGGGGIFVPMLTLIIGFDPKSSTAISKCMITGGAAATVLYNLKLRHPTLELPIIDYDLALLFQPMLILGISIGVTLNVLFADWMITILLIIFFLGISTRAFFKGVKTWKMETKAKKEAARCLQLNDAEDNEDVVVNPPSNGNSETKKKQVVPLLENVPRKELGLIVAVWVSILALQIAKNHTRSCSLSYWVLNALQIPVTFGVTCYEAVNLYKGKRVIASSGGVGKSFRVQKLLLCCACGIVAGGVGGLLGLGGGFILGPLFLEMGIPPQVSSATSIFVMTFSSSMSVVEYYLLKRFPVPYALYFATVAIIAALVGQHLVRKLIAILGRASLIIFILASTILVSAISLGGIGLDKMVRRIENKEYMGFDKLCT